MRQVILRELAREDFQDEDSEAPDIGLLGDAAELGVLGGLVGHHEVPCVVEVDQGKEAVVGKEWLEGVV